jgi:hypothetical protein
MPLPHTLESLLSILVAVRQDNTSDIGLSSSLSLQQSYTAMLVHLVNVTNFSSPLLVDRKLLPKPELRSPTVT